MTEFDLKDDSVNIDGLHPKILKALCVARRVWSHQAIATCVITSGRDGDRKPNSLHLRGRAVDLRRWNVPNCELALNQLRNDLGPDYDVLLEKDHFHIEYDPKP